MGFEIIVQASHPRRARGLLTTFNAAIYLHPAQAPTFSQCTKCPLRLHIHAVYAKALTKTHAFPAAATNLNCLGELQMAVAIH